MWSRLCGLHLYSWLGWWSSCGWLRCWLLGRRGLLLLLLVCHEYLDKQWDRWLDMDVGYCKEIELFFNLLG